MTEAEQINERKEIEQAARRTYEVDKRLQAGEVNTKNLREAGEAYKAYVTVRSQPRLLWRKALLRRLRMRAE